MSKRPILMVGAGVIGAAALGVAAWFVLRKRSPDEIVDQLEEVADQAREKAGGIARTLKEKATPIIQAIGDLVENNAELVSALANVNADQVRKTGQEIKNAAASLEKNLDALGNL
ncbi:MAG TPA: hypothetical protein VFJ58_18110 [Armatimonadota bacterium]|nr:hypothetical protein [Armatimonadota bacterium]